MDGFEADHESFVLEIGHRKVFFYANFFKGFITD